MISGFRHKADENCALLGYYAASSGIIILMFWDFWFLDPEDGTDRCP